MKLTKESLAPLYTNNKIDIADVAEAFGVSRSVIYSRAISWGLSRTRAEPDSPSEEEIAEMAAEIRSGWSREETEKRYVGPRRVPYCMPCFETSDLTGSNDLPVYARI